MESLAKRFEELGAHEDHEQAEQHVQEFVDDDLHQLELLHARDRIHPFAPIQHAVTFDPTSHHQERKQEKKQHEGNFTPVLRNVVPGVDRIENEQNRLNHVAESVICGPQI